MYFSFEVGYLIARRVVTTFDGDASLTIWVVFLLRMVEPPLAALADLANLLG
jgi:hypothetical protein